MQNLDDLFKEVIQKAMAERGHINISLPADLVSEKSTPINAVFQQNLAEIGQGRPVTRDTKEISKEGQYQAV